MLIIKLSYRHLWKGAQLFILSDKMISFIEINTRKQRREKEQKEERKKNQEVEVERYFAAQLKHYGNLQNNKNN